VKQPKRGRGGRHGRGAKPPPAAPAAAPPAPAVHPVQIVHAVPGTPTPAPELAQGAVGRGRRGVPACPADPLPQRGRGHHGGRHPGQIAYGTDTAELVYELWREGLPLRQITLRLRGLAGPTAHIDVRTIRKIIQQNERDWVERKAEDLSHLAAKKRQSYVKLHGALDELVIENAKALFERVKTALEQEQISPQEALQYQAKALAAAEQFLRPAELAEKRPNQSPIIDARTVILSGAAQTPTGAAASSLEALRGNLDRLMAAAGLGESQRMDPMDPMDDMDGGEKT